MAAAAVLGGGRVRRRGEQGVVFVLVTGLEAGAVIRMTITAGRDLSHPMCAGCAVAVGPMPETAVGQGIRMTVTAVCLVHHADDIPPMTAGALGDAGQSIMGLVLVCLRKIAGVPCMAIDTAPAMTAIDGLVVDRFADMRASSGVIMQRPATTARHMTGTAAAVDLGDELGVGVVAVLIMAARALKRARNLACTLVVDAMIGIRGCRIDLITMA